MSSAKNNDIYTGVPIDVAGWVIDDLSFKEKGASVTRSFDDVHITEYWLGQCFGRRSVHTQGESSRHFGLAFVISGSETCCSPSGHQEIRAGDILTWDGQSSQSFEVATNIHKLTLVVPYERLKGRHSKEIENSYISNRSEVGLLLSGYLKGFSELISRGVSNATLEMTLDIILRGIAISCPHANETPLLYRIKKYIDVNLKNPDLSPSLIAKENNISLRYLHKIFTGENLTLTAYIQCARLEACRNVISMRDTKRKISEVAFDYGFKDISHFTKLFKKRYALTPGEYRNKCFTEDSYNYTFNAIRKSTIDEVDPIC